MGSSVSMLNVIIGAKGMIGLQINGIATQGQLNLMIELNILGGPSW